MTSMSFKTPANVGTRDLVRAWLDAIMPADIKDNVIEVDCAPLKSPTPSFFDELLRILIVERSAKTVTLRHVNERAQSLAIRSARNRHIEDRVAIADPIADSKPTLLSRFRR
jgi:hypothetical protein